MKYFILLFLPSFIFICCADRTPKERNQFSELDQYFQRMLPADEPGGAVLVMKDTTVVFARGYGVEDVVTKKPISTTSLFNLGSISKTFVANAILILQEEGKLSVEDSLIKYFPEFKNKEIASKVKIKHLLTHTSGLPDSRNVNADTVFYLTAKDEENWKPLLGTQQLLFDPGSEFEYSNPAFNGLALIIEKVSGMKWQKFVEERIMKPSGMTLSTITDGPHPQEGVVHAYILNRGEWTEDDYGEEPTFAAAGNGGVWSSVTELAKYERAIQSSLFLSDKTIAKSRTTKTFSNWKGTLTPNIDWSWFHLGKDPDGKYQPFIGWSWFIGKTTQGLTVIGHTGTQGGFVCNYVTIPEKKIFFTILCNSPRDVEGLSNRVVESLESLNWLEK